MSKKASIYLGDRAETVIGEIKDSDSLSGRLNAIADRYGEIIDRARRQVLRNFSETELSAIRIACMSWATRQEPAGILIGGIAAEVEDALQGGDLSVQQWQPSDGKALLEKLNALSPAEQIALIEWLER
ncbi:hypothetical protein [Chitinimonas koreensis]|uniref:hypothetical protein n=1 Tax=Chitinimonas koreensis TaxID=356302 RepID=UPI0012FCA7B7|nr:hypothetical protein [Chitinimonas koreensis]QNM96404.1 hypothetical protein H9L41_21890 [Chitinimonas koreensis]